MKLKLTLFLLLPFILFSQANEAKLKEHIRLLELEAAQSDSIIHQLHLIVVMQQEAIDFNAVSPNLHKEQIENLTLMNTILKGLNEIHEKDKRSLLTEIDSLNSVNSRQQDEINVLTVELEKSIKHQVIGPASERKRLNEVSLTNIFVSDTITVRMKLLINDEGKVIVAKVLSATNVKDAQLLTLITDAVKNTLRYEAIENAALKNAFYTIKILPD